MTIRQSLQHPSHAPHKADCAIRAPSHTLAHPRSQGCSFSYHDLSSCTRHLILRCQPVRRHRLMDASSTATLEIAWSPNPADATRTPGPAVRVTLFQSYTTSKSLTFCRHPTVVCQNHQTIRASNLLQAQFHTLVLCVIFDCFQVAFRETNSIVHRPRFLALRLLLCSSCTSDFASEPGNEMRRRTPSREIVSTLNSAPKPKSSGSSCQMITWLHYARSLEVSLCSATWVSTQTRCSAPAMAWPFLWA
jgi:hypothetical protein